MKPDGITNNRGREVNVEISSRTAGVYDDVIRTNSDVMKVITRGMNRKAKVVPVGITNEMPRALQTTDNDNNGLLTTDENVTPTTMGNGKPTICCSVPKKLST